MVDKSKEACLARYRKNKAKRVKIARKVMKGWQIPEHWPQWQKFDILAEIKLIRGEHDTR